MDFTNEILFLSQLESVISSQGGCTSHRPCLMAEEAPTGQESAPGDSAPSSIPPAPPLGGSNKDQEEVERIRVLEAAARQLFRRIDREGKGYVTTEQVLALSDGGGAAVISSYRGGITLMSCLLTVSQTLNVI